MIFPLVSLERTWCQGLMHAQNWFHKSMGQSLSSQKEIQLYIPRSFREPLGTIYPDSDDQTTGKSVGFQTGQHCLFSYTQETTIRSLKVHAEPRFDTGIEITPSYLCWCLVKEANMRVIILSYYLGPPPPPIMSLPVCRGVLLLVDNTALALSPQLSTGTVPTFSSDVQFQTPSPSSQIQEQG